MKKWRNISESREKIFHVMYPFTLIELLVVILIIGVLASMLLPALSQTRKMVKRIHCASNMRQQNLGFMGYSSDYNEWFPGWNSTIPKQPGNTYGMLNYFPYNSKNISLILRDPGGKPEDYNSSEDPVIYDLGMGVKVFNYKSTGVVDPKNKTEYITMAYKPTTARGGRAPGNYYTMGLDGWGNYFGFDNGKGRDGIELPKLSFLSQTFTFYKASSGEKKVFAYLAIGGRTWGSAAQHPMTACLVRMQAHDCKGFNVVYVDGHVRWWTMPAYENRTFGVNGQDIMASPYDL